MVSLKDAYGGSISIHKRHVGYKPAWAWLIASAQADAFVRTIRPYLVIKASEADVWLAARALCNGRKKTQDEAVHMSNLRGQLLSLRRAV